MQAVAEPGNRLIDPRVERSKEVILRASLAELGEVGYGRFSIESVAARAGVGKSTIYRHWPDKLALIADAFETLHEDAGPQLGTGSSREKLELILRHVAEVVSDSPFSACMPAMIDAAERDARLRRFHHDFQRAARQPLVQVIAGAVAAGELRRGIDPELAAFELLGAIFFQRLMTAKPFDPGRAGDLVDTLFGPA